MDNLSVFLETLELPDIVCLSETWLKSFEMNSMKLNKYKLIDYFSRTDQGGGGVAIFARDCLSVNKKISNVPKISSDFEHACAEILLNNNSTIIVNCVYRAPTGNFNTFIRSLDDLLLKQILSPKQTFICGDFNTNLDPNVPNKNAQDLKTMCLTYGLKPYIHTFTRLQGSHNTIIDNIFSNVETNIITSYTVPCDFSDHNLQMIAVKTAPHNVSDKVIFYRCFKKEVNIKKFQYLCSTETWNTVDFSNNAEFAFNSFHQRFIEIFNLSFPQIAYKIKNKIRKPDKKWISDNIINEGILLRDLHPLIKESDDNNLKTIYSQLKKQHYKNISNAKKTYFDSLMLNTDNKTKTAWQIINNNVTCSTPKHLPNSFLNDEGEFIAASDAPEAFNNYFINSIDKLTSKSKDISLEEGNSRCKNSMFLSPVTPIEVAEIIRTVARKDARGFDDVPCSILLHVVDLISEPLSKLINLSFMEGIFPDLLKQAVLIPIHKRGDVKLLSNYRAISLLCPFSKVYETAYSINLNAHLITNQLISKHQYAFQKGLSTQDALMSICKFILNNLDSKNKTACIYFDLSRAFDTVNHQLLLQKMQSLGIRGPPLDWMSSYLSNRLQKVHLKISGTLHTSNYTHLTVGIPQGSTLGPILFLMFVNDMESLMINSNNQLLSMFADDTTFAIGAQSLKDLSDKAMTCAILFQNYCTKNGLAMNSNKTELLCFSPLETNTSLLLKIDGKSVPEKNTVKYLGLHMDNHLQWYEHIDNLSTKMAKGCYMLWQLRNFVSVDVLKMYYFAHLESSLNYGIICWGNSYRISDLFSLQKKVIRTITFKNSRHSCRELFPQLGILTLPSLYILSCVVFVKSKHLNITTFGDREIDYNLRYTNNLLLPQHRLSLVANGPTVMPVKLYNHLPHNIKELFSIQKFKFAVKRMLLEKSFYSVQEFLNAS